MDSPIVRSRAERSVISAIFIALVCATTAFSSLPAVGAAPDRFIDDENSVHEGAIDAIAEIGITTGCNPPANDRYCPERPLTRGEMASMIVRASDFDTAPASRFVDLNGTIHRHDIEALAAADVTRGCNPPRNDRFCPDALVTRGQMATFLTRYFGLEDPDPSSTPFTDTTGTVHEHDVDALAAQGITKGCNPPTNDRFCPERPVTRGEVATFFARALDLDVADDGPGPGSPPAGESDGEGPGGGGGTPPPPPTGPGWRPAYPGQPRPGTVLWGAAVGQNSDPAPRHEVPTGEPLSVRRTFYQWNHRTGYMIQTVTEDVSRGRLPWVSIKTPGWQEMASGAHDADIDAMLRALDRIDGPVWLTIHHEPEGGGGVNSPDDPAGPAGHLAMNRRVRQRMNAVGVDNVALAPILMDWTWDPASGRNPNAWWDPDVYDFVGVDHYVCYSGSTACVSESLLNDIWYDVRAWAADQGVDVAVGEWGMRGDGEDAARRLRAWYEAAVESHSDGRGARVAALSAFDSDANVPQSYVLVGRQLTTFHELLTDDRTAEPAP